MCCFSRAVEFVADTKIFARMSQRKQFLAYSMRMGADEELAMILPLPVKKNTPEDGVQFISLEEYPDFFKDLKKGFPEPASARPRSRTLSAPVDSAPPKLEVVQVGSFEASFVPAVKDFSRLDARFRLPEGTWEQLPAYADYGFAVFKLKSGKQNVHPMALQFPTANPNHLFFPTVHIHDGKVHKKAGFDHELYCQWDGFRLATLRGWRESPQPAEMFMKIDKSAGLVHGDDHCYLRTLRGNLKNGDVWI